MTQKNKLLAFIALEALSLPVILNAQHSAHTAEHSSAIATGPQENGQSTFAAIQEIVDILAANPETEWENVNIDALREHLRDMNLVFVDAEVTSEPTDSGAKYTVTGEGRVREAIVNMVTAHAAVMEGVDDWNYMVETHPNGAILKVTVPSGDIVKLRGLGFFGVMASGMHHQEHHLAISTGANPHH